MPFWLILAAGAFKKSIRTQYFCPSNSKKCFLYKRGADFYIFADLLRQALGRPYAAATKYTPFRASSRRRRFWTNLDPLFWGLGPLVLHPLCLGPRNGEIGAPFWPPWPVFAPLKTPSWPPECVQEGCCTAFFLLLAHSNAYNIVACSKKMRIVSCFLKKGQLFKKDLLNICFSKVLLVRICFFCRVAFQ